MNSVIISLKNETNCHKLCYDYVIFMYEAVVLIFDFNLNYILMSLKSECTILKGYPHLLKKLLKQVKK